MWQKGVSSVDQTRGDTADEKGERESTERTAAKNAFLAPALYHEREISKEKKGRMGKGKE
jgi:hypothetical protein